MRTSPLKAVFLDLDDTLTEYPGGFGSILRLVYQRAVTAGAPAEAYDVFSRAYWNSTCGLWASMHAGAIHGDEVRLMRMRRGLASLSIADEALAARLHDEWDDLALGLPVLRDGALELLAMLRGRVFVALITDGYADLQRRKLARLDLVRWFDHVQISEEAGTCKPFARTFQLALEAAQVNPLEAVMVGDNVNSDVRGALGVGMRAIYLDPTNSGDTPHGAERAGNLLEVRRLIELWLSV